MNNYSELGDIKARLPFEVDSKSYPTESELQDIQDNITRFINAYIGTDKTSSAPDGLRWVETELAAQDALVYHREGTILFTDLTKKHKQILDDHRSTKVVDIEEFEWSLNYNQW